MELKWLGHSCFRVSCAGYSIVLDPFEPGSVPGLRDVNEKADEVLCSHGHHDHNWVQAVTINGRGGKSPFKIETIDTFHDPEEGALRGKNRIHILSAGGVRIAHLGDLGCPLTPEQIKTLGRLDAVLCPVGGYYTIDAREAKAITDGLELGAIIPMHYRTVRFGFDVIGTLEDFLSLYPAEEVDLIPGDTLTLRPGMPRRVTVLDYPER